MLISLARFCRIHVRHDLASHCGAVTAALSTRPAPVEVPRHALVLGSLASFRLGEAHQPQYMVAGDRRIRCLAVREVDK